VADKGVPAALLMARVTGLLRVTAQAGARPDQILRKLDRRLSEGNDACMFVTAVCGQLDGDSGQFWLASAGHERPLLRRVDGATTTLAVQGGPALGLELNDPYPLSTGVLAPGDAIVLFTDGVTEAFDAQGVAFGSEGLRRVVADTPADALTGLPEQLVDAVEEFTAGGAPRDDLAVLVVQYAPIDVDLSGADEGVWRLTASPTPDGAAWARRRIEGILRARDVAEAAIDHCLSTAERALAIAARDGGDSGGSPIHVDVHVQSDDIRICIEETRPSFDSPSAAAREAPSPTVPRPA
jgi:sigma-B regulation protein RsbU (phosphoserine phosphatase)